MLVLSLTLFAVDSLKLEEILSELLVLSTFSLLVDAKPLFLKLSEIAVE